MLWGKANGRQSPITPKIVETTMSLRSAQT
jgi:hypothetical protein